MRSDEHKKSPEEKPSGLTVAGSGVEPETFGL